jgi:integrase
MPRLRQAIPKYRKHRANGHAVVTLNGRDHYLGPDQSRASLLEYDRLVGEWLARHRQPIVEQTELTIAVLAARYHAYAKCRYVKDGKPTTEIGKVETSLRCVLRLYADHIAAEFRPLHLKVVRQSMIEVGWARSYINQQVRVIVRIFKWAGTEGLLPAAVHDALALVDSLRRGESTARETSKVRGVDNATVQATLVHLSPTVRAMIELQLATGMRPGELCIMRPCDVDRTSDVLEYLPTRHKGDVHGHDRTICIGPTGQDILRPYLLRPADSFCFSPKESAEWHRV